MMWGKQIVARHCNSVRDTTQNRTLPSFAVALAGRMQVAGKSTIWDLYRYTNRPIICETVIIHLRRLDVVSGNCRFICVITYYKCIPRGLVGVNEFVIRMCPVHVCVSVFHSFRLSCDQSILINWSTCIISFTAATGFLFSKIFIFPSISFMNSLFRIFALPFPFALTFNVI